MRDMDNVTMTVRLSAVMEEVARTTSYAGAKMMGEAGTRTANDGGAGTGEDDALDRIATVDEDQEELMRFWNESRAEIARALMQMLVFEGMAEDGDTYEVILNVTEDFDDALLPGMEHGLFSYFVQSITAKWFLYTNKQEAGGYAEIGKALLDDVRQKAFYKKAPKRPRYDEDE